MAQHRRPALGYNDRRALGAVGLLLALVLFLAGWHAFIRYDGLGGYLGLLLLTVSAVAALVDYEWMQR